MGLDYRIQNALTDPVDEVMNHLVALNYFAAKARERGWRVVFEVNENEDAKDVVGVMVARDVWPDPEALEEEPRK